MTCQSCLTLMYQLHSLFFCKVLVHFLHHRDKKEGTRYQRATVRFLLVEVRCQARLSVLEFD